MIDRVTIGDPIKDGDPWDGDVAESWMGYPRRWGALRADNRKEK